MRRDRGRQRRNGECSCAITTSSILAGLRRRNAVSCSRRSVPRRICRSMTAASAGGSHRCSMAIGVVSSSHTASCSMFTLPGTPVVRYGDELGMGDNLALRERVCCRTPMQWSTEPNGGFTKNTKPIVPVINEGPYGYQHVNAAEQRRDANSLLNWTERIIRMRKEVPEIGWGDFKVLDTGDRAVLGLRYDWRNNSVLFLHNLAAEPREVEFSTGLKSGKDDILVNLLSQDHSRPVSKDKHRVCMDAYGYRWYRVGGLYYLLKRSEF